MIHNDIQHQLQLLIKTSAPPLIEVAEHAAGTPQWTPGQRLPAHVLASLPNGRFEVKVGDQVLDLNLPRNTQAGDTLELTYLSSSPRLTFALTRDLANTLPANTPVSLSETARFIGSLVQKGTAEQPQVAQTAKAVPVVSSLPASTADFAQSLKQAVSQSGLFYESHQVQWLSGERHVSSLLQEPQGRLSPMMGREPAQANAAGNNPGALTATAKQDIGEDAVQKLPAGIENSRGTNTSGFRTTDADGPLFVNPQQVERSMAEPVHPKAIQHVQQQLQTLDTHQIIWQGQVWPGQEMRWEIEEDSSRREESGEEESSSWHTTLNLQLPSLGSVSAKLAFVGGAIQLDISTQDPASADLMRRAQAVLAERFESSGLQLSGVAIRHHGE
jgi:hypothetical protein